ncbi:MAG TPA: hypothetical protein VK464_22935 [Symbiobacteriaceae bacterium]|jgi:hypothetical protein|nr:hypothetical protein [Symbiobacteriaceae bacterium]
MITVANRIPVELLLLAFFFVGALVVANRAAFPARVAPDATHGTSRKAAA